MSMNISYHNSLLLRLLQSGRASSALLNAMSSLLDLAIDLINDAKGSKDAKSKLYMLEQVKEIVMFRDKSVLKDIISTMLDFMVEKSVPIRKFLVQFAGDVMSVDRQLVFPLFVNLVHFVSSDANDGLLAVIAIEFNKYRNDIALLIAGMVVTPKAPVLSDPKQLWPMFKAISAKLSDCLGSDKSDRLKLQCIKLYQTEILFGLPESVAASSSAAKGNADPRLARKDPRLARAAAKAGAAAATASASNGGANSADGSSATSNIGGDRGSDASAEQISLHHSFLSRNEIQQDAEDQLSRALLWASKGGPQGHPFSPLLMATLGEVVANVGSSRLQHSANAAKALCILVQGKGSVVKEMSGLEREGLARSIHRLLRSASRAADVDGDMPKLRAAVATLEALGLQTTSEVAAQAQTAAVVGTKRARKGSAAAAAAAAAAAQAAEEALAADAAAKERTEVQRRQQQLLMTGMEEEELRDAEQRRATAVAALDAAEVRMKSLSMLAANMMGGAGVGVGVGVDATIAGGKVNGSGPAAAGAVSSSSSHVVAGEFTELSTELAPLTSPSSLSTLELVSTTSTSVVAAAAAAVDDQVVLRPLAQEPGVYADLALSSLVKLLESYATMEQMGEKVCNHLYL